MVEARAGAASADADPMRMARARPAIAAVTCPDLDIAARHVFLNKRAPVVIVCGLGPAAARGRTLFLEDSSGRTVTSTKIAAPAAPTDLTTETVQVRCAVPAGAAVDMPHHVPGDGVGEAALHR